MTALSKLKGFKLSKFKQRRYLLVGVLVLLVLVAVAYYLTRPLAAGVFTVAVQDFSKGFTEEGAVIAAQEWLVFNPFEGKILSLKVKNGDQVTKGQALLEMDRADLNFQLQGLQTQLQGLESQRIQLSGTYLGAQAAQQSLSIEQAAKDLETQKVNLTRMQALYEAGALSLVQYEEAQSAVQKLENILAQQKEGLTLINNQQQTSQNVQQSYVNQKKAVQAQINYLQDKIAKAAVVAQMDGIVKDLTLKEGQVLPPGQQVMTVYAGGYKLESYVLASDALEIKAGNAVKIIQATGSGNISLSGQVEAIDVSAVERLSPLGLKENRVKVTIAFTADSPVVLGSDLDVQYTTVTVPGQLLVPKTALFSWQDGEAVWSVQQGRAKIQPVKKGLENDSQVIIEEGLAEGDTVIQDPNLTGLKEGISIKALS
ncbi:MAG TPA: HlyD family efflux transporter periplasmic adaptor subunit [Desulfitobacteriaceae bacterium]|nr:HlyD family efflux transporter periplasmic adaptor subunit [Desulfitobacteriaceae bacterium]